MYWNKTPIVIEWSGRPRAPGVLSDLSLKSISRTEYKTVTEEKCEVQYETEYTTVYNKECQTVYDTKASFTN